MHEHSPHTQIIGVEPAGASSMYESVVVQNKVVTLEHIDKFVDGASVAVLVILPLILSNNTSTTTYKLMKVQYVLQF